MTLEFADFLILISITTVLTTASTTVITFKQNGALERRICDKIGRVHERINSIAIRLGIVESEHQKH